MNPELLNQLFDTTPLTELDLSFPGYNFMQLVDKRDGTAKVVGTTQTIGGEPLYVELPLTKGLEAADLGVLIHQELEQQADARRWDSKGYTSAYHTPKEWQELKAAEVKKPSKQKQKKLRRAGQ